MLKELKLISIIVLIILIFKFLFNIFKNKKSNEVKIDMAKKKQDNFRRTLEDMANILNYNNIPFHLHSGTALGAIREKRFIPNDSDIDIAIFERDKVRNLENLVVESGVFNLIHKLPLDSKENEVMEISFGHKIAHIKIDIFYVVEEDNKYKIYSYYGICDDKPKKRCEYINSKYKLNDIIFFGSKYKVPEIKFLEEQYGMDWRVPKNFSYTDGINGDYKNMNPSDNIDLTIGIKTFCRPKVLEESLANITNNKLKFKILVSDDSDDEYKEMNKKIIDKFKFKYDIRLLDLPFDSGLSRGRNEIVNNCNTKYLMIIDDSRYFTNDLPILKMIKFLDNSDYDLFSGVIESRNGRDRDYVCLFDKVEKKDKDVNITCKKKDKIENNLFENLFETNIGLNVFIAKTNSLRNTLWRNKLKLWEHSVFFYDFYNNGFKCVYSPDVKFNQVKNRPYPTKYSKFRLREFLDDGLNVNINF